MASGISSRPEPEFESPFKPPPGFADLIADTDQDSGYPYTTVISGQLFRFRRAQPRGIVAFVCAQSKYNPNKNERLKQLMRFAQRHVHPDDLARMLTRLIDDDAFGVDQLDELLRAIAKAGTSRPIPPS